MRSITITASLRKNILYGMALKHDRHRKTGKGSLRVWLAIGILYFFWVKATGDALPCPLHSLTGYYCPSCGITTMMLCLSVGDFRQAFSANPAILILSPVIIWLIVCEEFSFFHREDWQRRVNGYLLGFVVVALLIYGVCRNIF